MATALFLFLVLPSAVLCETLEEIVNGWSMDDTDFSITDFSPGGRGTIPASIGRLTRATRIDLADSRITGTIPDTIGELTALEFLNLYANRINGTIPAAMASLTALTELKLDQNGLSGTLPDGLGDLPALVKFDASEQILSGQGLQGTIPASFFLSTSLTEIKLYKNRLTGTIPEVGSDSVLEWAELWQNNLEGTIPVTLANLDSLRLLWLQDNQLTGAVPVGACEVGVRGRCWLAQGNDRNSFDCPVSDWRDPCGRDCAPNDICNIMQNGSYLDCGGGQCVGGSVSASIGIRMSMGALSGVSAAIFTGMCG